MEKHRKESGKMKHIITDTRDINGDGANVFMKDDKFVVEITDDAGMSGGVWFMDINMLIDEIGKYRIKQLSLTSKNNNAILNM